MFSNHHNNDLFSLARSKLHLSVGGGRDNRSLHRWVLLKNSILGSPTASLSHACHPAPTALQPTNSEVDSTEDESEAFMFPDAGRLLNTSTSQACTSEAQWLDTLLESLGDDDDDDDFSFDSSSVTQQEDDDDSFLISPLISPMSSSDDLASSSTFFRPHLYPPVIYPPYHPPPTPWDTLHAPSAWDIPLPYHNADLEVEELSVPDAIEDTSDDESDAPATPSDLLGRSNEAFPVLDDPHGAFPLVDPASIPLPPERSRLRHVVPHVYVEADDVNFYPFDVDPLPFAHDLHSYNHQEC